MPDHVVLVIYRIASERSVDILFKVIASYAKHDDEDATRRDQTCSSVCTFHDTTAAGWSASERDDTKATHTSDGKGVKSHENSSY